MSYSKVIAASVHDIRDAIVTACTADGWSWQAASGALSKGTISVRLQIEDRADPAWNGLQLFGVANGSESPGVVRIGPIAGGTSKGELPPWTFPVTCEVFTFEQEVYCVVTYAADTIQWMAFGKSTLPLPGTGTWVAASLWGTRTEFTSVSMQVDGGGVGGASFCPGLMWASGGTAANSNYWIHHDLDNRGWLPARYSSGIGVGYTDPLMKILPSTWNNEAAMLRIRHFFERTDSWLSMTCDLENARHMRIDYHDPGEIVTIGTDRWKIYPYFRKNTESPLNGNPNHSGCFGMAVRYEGP